MLVLCKEASFPFPIYTWTPGEFKFQLWSPINSLDDIDKISKAWKKITDSWDQEKFALFNSTKIKNFSYTVRALPEISYEPANARYTMDEVTYGQWNELYLIPGNVNEAKKLIKEFVDLAKAKNYNDPWNYFEGGIGYETPVLIAVSLAKNMEDLLQQDKEI